MTHVLDAGVAFWACGAEGRLEKIGLRPLVAPRLLWSECLSVLHEALWRREISRPNATLMRERLSLLAVERVDPPELAEEAWRVAEELGWAKTYDAEYVALARLLGGTVISLDVRMLRRVGPLGLAVALADAVGA